MVREDHERHVDEMRERLKTCETSTDEPMTMVYPTIFCDDAISRDALKKMLIGLDKWHIKNKQFVNVGLLYDDVFFGIEQLPSVTPSRHKGHWIRKVDFGNCVHYVCSECKNEGEEDYCPNCGAYMVEPQESED